MIPGFILLLIGFNSYFKYKNIIKYGDIYQAKVYAIQQHSINVDDDTIYSYLYTFEVEDDLFINGNSRKAYTHDEVIKFIGENILVYYYNGNSTPVNGPSSMSYDEFVYYLIGSMLLFFSGLMFIIALATNHALKLVEKLKTEGYFTIGTILYASMYANKTKLKTNQVMVRCQYKNSNGQLRKTYGIIDFDYLENPSGIGKFKNTIERIKSLKGREVNIYYLNKKALVDSLVTKPKEESY